MNRLLLTAIFVRIVGIALLIFTLSKALITVPLPYPEMVNGKPLLSTFGFYFCGQFFENGETGMWILFFLGIFVSLLFIGISQRIAKWLWLGIRFDDDSQSKSNLPPR